jgi:transcriptional regulator with XRE-family HTH domain
VKDSYANLNEFFKDNPDVTQAALAEELGISPNYVSMLASGERQPSLPLAIRISERTRVPIAALVQKPTATEPSEAPAS